MAAEHLERVLDVCHPEVREPLSVIDTEAVRYVEISTQAVLQALTEMLGPVAQDYQVAAIQGPYDRLGRFLHLVLRPKE